MRKQSFAGFAALAALVMAAAPGRAQVFTPTFQSTERGSDVGVYLSDGPGSLAVEGIWRRAVGPDDLGLRLGFADIGKGDLLLGADWRHGLALGTQPVDVALTLGAQAAVGDVNALGAQVGLVFGHTFNEPGLHVTPYVHPRLAIAGDFGDQGGSQVNVLADLGADFRFAPNLALRVGIGLGDFANWGIGLAWRR
ncbi:MAG TPA: hypothetical protein VGO40_00060 [Longimicrobium sp.]|jgi:hypothetical protein|nr:hypothetical protein [Longimicrobium sp.]